MFDLLLVIVLIFTTAVSVECANYERRNDHVNRGLIVDRIDCEDTLKDVFKQSIEVTEDLKKCERKKIWKKHYGY